MYFIFVTNVWKNTAFPNFTWYLLIDLVPGEPRKVKIEAVNSTAVNVQWRPPLEREQNGIIRGYQIYYTRLDENDEHVGSALMQDINDGLLSIFLFKKFYETFPFDIHNYCLYSNVEPIYNVSVEWIQFFLYDIKQGWHYLASTPFAIELSFLTSWIWAWFLRD